MNSFFSIIGSIASLVSIPLAVYLYIKSKESDFFRLKRDIVRILSYQIGDQRKLSMFELKTVIFSKLRENKKRIDAISISEIVEDLVLEIITNPLIDREQKTFTLDNLKLLYLKDDFKEVSGSDRSMDKNKQGDNYSNFDLIIETTKELENSIKKGIETTNKNANIYKQNLSTLYAASVTIIIICSFFLIFILRTVSLNFNESLNEVINNFVNEDEFLFLIVSGSFLSIISFLTTFIYLRFRKIKKKFKL